MDGIAVAGEIVTAATALAGLILVYLGSLATAYSAFEPQEQKSVQSRFQKRAWLAFTGMILALIAAALGVLGKWLPNECVADASMIILLITFAWGALIALLTVQELG